MRSKAPYLSTFAAWTQFDLNPGAAPTTLACGRPATPASDLSAQLSLTEPFELIAS
jgi:hypothetical protein